MQKRLMGPHAAPRSATRHAMAMLFVLIVLASPQRAAAVLDATGTDILVLTADAIVVGGVVQQSSDYDAPGTSIETETTVGVQQLIYGSVGPVPLLRVRTPGGDVPDGVSHAAESASLTVGETVVLLLRQDGADWQVNGGLAGVFPVVNGIVQATGEPLSLFVASLQALLGS